MWETVTKHIGDYPGSTLILFIIYVVVTAATAATAVYRWVYSAYVEAKKDYLAKLSLYCEDVADIAAQIAVSDDYPKEQIARFWTYYYGKTILVEDKNLEGKMVVFGNVLDDTTEENFPNQRGAIESAVLELSGACRDLMKKSWNLAIVPWRDLQEKRSDQDQDNQRDKQLQERKRLDQGQNVTSR